ncbi:MAG: acyl-CoA dehydrogenase family protein [Deltaproteobacteria bacterium]|nr:acyl-CoA dehydrogenase family protein [Deltaproteobacteria bacterium]
MSGAGSQLRDPPASVVPLLDELRRFMDERVKPLERAVLSQPFVESLPLLRPLREEAKRRGLWAPQMPKAWGGQGLSMLEHGFVSEVLGAVPFAHWVLNCQAPDAGNMEILLHFGTPAQQERFLRPLVEGAVRSCFSMTEPDRPGSNPTWLETRARRDGSGWVIDGTKWFTSSADGAAFAVVMAVTDEDAPPHRRASMLLVPMDTPGVRLVRNISVMGHAGSDWPSHAELAYEGVRVPADAVLGEVGAGFAIAQERLGPGRIHHCMRWLGVCARAYELHVERAATRPFAPFVPLGALQMVQEQIALSRIEIHAARLMVLDAAHRIDAVGQKEARDEIAMIKVFVARTMQAVLDRAVQAHGALGVTDDLPLAAFFRHERAARIYDGPDEVHLAALARRALKAHGVKVP